MSLLEKIRNKPYEEKIRLIWAICAVTALILAIVWILTSRIKQDLPKDTSLFQTIGSGVKNLRK
ncbi:MAG: hypothetical protein HYZ51_03890 [Candidatus Doudnabacteria bacterium]|nr:hypothetical protein [Candidatus Doudnabacteria bacterium]